MSTNTNTEPQGGARLLIDLGPLLVFFGVNFFAPVPGALKIFVATGAFMVAMVAAMLFSAIRYRAISPLLWFSGVMVVLLGGLTIWLHDETFIKMKPTVYYALVAGLLAFGLATDRPLLQRVLGSSYPGLDQHGWAKLTRNWALFFAFMALLNSSPSWPCSTRPCGATARPISGSASSCGEPSPSLSCSLPPTSRC
jgi:intracellular septation protein